MEEKNTSPSSLYSKVILNIYKDNMTYFWYIKNPGHIHCHCHSTAEFVSHTYSKNNNITLHYQ